MLNRYFIFCQRNELEDFPWVWCSALICLAVRSELLAFERIFIHCRKQSSFMKIFFEQISSGVSVRPKLVSSVIRSQTRGTSRILLVTHTCACTAQNWPAFMVTREAEHRWVVCMCDSHDGKLWFLVSN